MIGLRAGLAASLFASVAVGVGADQIASQGGTTTLTLSLADSADPVITAVNFNITADISNTGSYLATSLSCAITLDSSLTYVSSSGSGWSFGVAGQVVTATRASLAAGAAPQIVITVTSGGTALTASTGGSLSASNASTVTDTETTVVKLVSKDATSGIRVPATSTEWTDFIAYYGLTASVPDALWLLQDASGNPADAIGSFTLTASGTGLGYQAAVTGWTRKAITTTEAGSGQLASTSASLPDISTTSMMTMAFVKYATGASTRQLSQMGPTTRVCARFTTTPRMRLLAGATSTDGTVDPTGAVRPVITQINRTGTAQALYTDQEKVVPTFDTTPTGKKVSLGSDGTGIAPAASFVYACSWFAGHAELSAANVKALLQALGWTIPWS